MRFSLLAGGILTTYAGWRYIFFFNVPIGVAALALVPKVVPESRARSGPRRYDAFGAMSITAALLVLVYAISQAPQAGWTATQTVAMLAAGAALFALFLVVEARVEAPLLPLRLFRLGSVAGSNGVAAGLVNTSQNFGSAIGVAVASSIVASYSHTLAHHGYATATALTGGLQRALWVCGLTGLAAIPLAFVLIRRTGRS